MTSDGSAVREEALAPDPVARPGQEALRDVTLRPAALRDAVGVQVGIRGGRLDRFRWVRAVRVKLGRAVSRADGLIRFETPGRLTVHVPVWDAQELVMARRAPLLPEYMVRAVRAAVRPGSVVVDGGANLGAFSLCAAACLDGDGQVLAFEPDPRNRAALAASVEASGFRRTVSVVPAALGDRPASLSFWLSETDGALSSLIRRSDRDTETRVEVVALDEYLETAFGSSRADIVKLDLEGGEALAFRGMAAALRSARLLIFEVNDPQLRRAGHDPVTVTTDCLEAGAFDHVLVANDCTGETFPYDEGLLRSMLEAERFVNVVCTRS